MKNKIGYYVVIFGMLAAGCLNINENTYDEYEWVDIYTYEHQSFEDFRATSVKIIDPVAIEKSGKIYAYNQYLFVNDMDKGIHIIDNSNPRNPQKIKFLGVEGSSEIEIKGHFLYTNSYMDLVVFDLSNIFDVQLEARAKDVFLNSTFHNDSGVYKQKVEKKWLRKDRRQTECFDCVFFSDTNTATVSGNKATSGQGGSLARFKIVNDFLYAVDDFSIDVFSLADISEPKKVEKVNVGWGIETIFNRGNHLFLGSRNGMYIYNIDTPKKPVYVSALQHVQSCDPVVVDGNFAYVTLRGGNLCGASESTLDVIDIADLKNPTLVKQYSLENPYGLGVKNNFLFICDGTAGMKVYDKTDNLNLKLLNTFKNVAALDVIPLDNSLIMIGLEVLSQYNYTSNGLELLSEFSLK